MTVPSNSTAGAEVYAANSAAEVEVANAEAEVHLDYDSKNREFNFTVTLAETREFVIVKPALADVFALTDVAAVHPSKVPAYSVTISDTAYRVMTKAIADGFAVDDSALIDKDYVGTKGNVATMSDILELLYARSVADSYSMSDVLVQVWQYVRNFNDAIVLGDLEFNPLGTITLNTRVLNTSNSLFQLTKGNDQADAFGILDTAALTPGKNFTTDTFTFSDTHSYSSGKGVSDTFGCTDVFYMDFKTFTDSLSLSDTLHNHFYDSETIADNIATVSDSLHLSYITGGVLNAAGVPLNNMTLN